MIYKLISSRKDVSPIEQVLVNRGFSTKEIETYLNLTDDVLIDCMKLDNIERATHRVLKALCYQEKIYVQVDCDCDGYTSSALLINYLHDLFPATVENNLYYGLHANKDHGIDVDNIPDGVTLVIAPDASSNENEIHKKLAENGIDVVVLDHHHAEKDADDPAIIVNNQMCNYDNKALSGVGIVFKFCQAFDILLETNFAENYRDLVALGLIGDMMDIRSFETRRLIDIGLVDIKNPFFKEMCKKQEFPMNYKVNIMGVAFYIVPFINGITRSGSPEEQVLIFEAMLNHRADVLIPSTKRGHKGEEERLVTQAVRTSANVKKHQDDEKNEALEDLFKEIDEKGLADAPAIILQIPTDIERNLTGLLANAIMAKYNRPTFLLRERINQETGEVTWEGSARAFEMGNVRDWRKFVEPYALYAEGHASAFGVGFTPDQINKFKFFLARSFRPNEYGASHRVDFEFNYEEDFDEVIKSIGAYSDLWGQGLTQPKVVIKNVPVSLRNIVLMNKGTLKILLGSHPTNCIKFAAKEDYDAISSNLIDHTSTVKMNLLGYCTINEYMGTKTPQIQLVDWEITQIDPWGF